MSLKPSSAQSKDTAGHSRVRRWFQLLLDTVSAFWADDCYTKAAALSYYAVLSVLPLLILLVIGASLVATYMAPGLDINRVLLDFVERYAPPEIADWIQNTLPPLEQQLPLLSGINILILLWSAANIFRQLNLSINAIWGVYDESESSSSVRSMATWYMRDQYRSLTMLLAAFGLFLLDHILRLVLYVLRELLSALPLAARWEGRFGTPVADATVFILDVLALSLLYRYFPPVRIPWRVVLPGAILGAIIIVAAGIILGLIFSGLFAGIYAALGGPIALMLWVNMVGQGVLLGCELTRQRWLWLENSQRAVAVAPGAIG
ncbi:MAG TPA: YhjD/YihY/BrkB family envelope integrity protein [Roseiflexaceae bacterium]|nr:YhjD/YihY/BrkB family envelope integrity protein [Roseiflexaceae bacterium]